MHKRKPDSSLGENNSIIIVLIKIEKRLKGITNGRTEALPQKEPIPVASANPSCVPDTMSTAANHSHFNTNTPPFANFCKCTRRIRATL